MDSSIRSEEKSSFLKKTGLFLTFAAGGAAVCLSIVCLPFLSPAFRRICLPYVPATTTQVQNVMKALEGKTGKVVDLGSGDGRLVISAAQKGFFADGVELNFWLVLYSRLQALRYGVSKNTSFYRKDLWKFNLSPYENVIIFGVEEMMPELEKKCQTELKNNAVIIACRFPFVNMKPNTTIDTNIDSVWVYRIKR